MSGFFPILQWIKPTQFQESAGATRISQGQNGNRIENPKYDLGDCLVSSGD